jgi:hypothetical protein
MMPSKHRLPLICIHCHRHRHLCRQRRRVRETDAVVQEVRNLPRPRPTLLILFDDISLSPRESLHRNSVQRRRRTYIVDFRPQTHTIISTTKIQTYPPFPSSTMSTLFPPPCAPRIIRLAPRRPLNPTSAIPTKSPPNLFRHYPIPRDPLTLNNTCNQLDPKSLCNRSCYWHPV